METTYFLVLTAVSLAGLLRFVSKANAHHHGDGKKNNAVHLQEPRASQQEIVIKRPAVEAFVNRHKRKLEEARCQKNANRRLDTILLANEAFRSTSQNRSCAIH